MISLRPVIFVLGIFLLILSAFMLIPIVVDLYFHNPDWQIFLMCMIITAFFGGAMALSCAFRRNFTINVRQGFLMTTGAWIVLSAFSALPLWLSELNISATDAVFEAVSGMTTTGASILENIESAPPGILIWRAVLQWLGGIGIIVTAMSILPFLGVGGMQLFRTESSENEKALPRAAQLASSIGLVYLGLTILCALGYGMAGMTTFNAIAHAMTTIATGGYSTINTSFEAFNNAWREIIAIIFMFAGALPFILYLKAVSGNIRPLLKNAQVRFFIGAILVGIIILSIYVYTATPMGVLETLRRSAFSVVAIITTTGYSNAGYDNWGAFAIAFFFFLMVIGGCAGSTACGIKIFRFQILFSVIRAQLKQTLYPNAKFTAHYNGRPIPAGVPTAVISFLFLYALCFAVLACLLSMTGLNFITALSGAAASISNIGPGLGPMIGPEGTYQSLNDAAKWLLSAGMILGRLELLTVLVLFTPHFWRI